MGLSVIVEYQLVKHSTRRLLAYILMHGISAQLREGDGVVQWFA